MPSIRQNPEQQKALEDVTTALAELKNMNILSAGEWANSVMLAFNNGGSGRGSTIKVQIDANAKEDEKDIAAIMRVLQNRRARIAKEALARAEKFDIRLDEEEEATLRGELPQRKRRKKIEAEETPAADTEETGAAEQSDTSEAETEQPYASAAIHEQNSAMGMPQQEPQAEPSAETFDADAFAADDEHVESDGDEDAELAQALGQYNGF